MSQLAAAPKAKKRKQAQAAVDDVAGPSKKKSRKEAEVLDASVKAKAAKAGVNGKDKGKGKARAKPEESEFREVHASVVLSVPPVFAGNARAGVEEMLDSMVMRYTPAFQGVALAHSNLHFANQNAVILGDSPFAVCRVEFDATVWSPRVGMKLSGTISLCSPDHVSLLVHRTFNVAIPRHHLPTDSWEFEYGPAENDPEFGAGGGAEEVAEAEDDPEAAAEEAERAGIDAGGRWVHKITGERLGGADGTLVFTVVGLTVANQMLSLVGSIQPDPFAPEHVPETSRPRAKSPPRINRTQVPLAALSEDENEDDADEDQEESEDEDEDVRRLLEEQAAKEEEQGRKEAEALAKTEKKEKKRKRKEAADADGRKRKKES